MQDYTSQITSVRVALLHAQTCMYGVLDLFAKIYFENI